MIIAIDTGGTKTLLAGFSKEGKLLKSFEFQTPKYQQKYLEIIEKVIKKEFSEQLKSGEIQAISCAEPGIIENGVILWAKNLRWQNFNVKAELSKIFPNIKILVENDANLAGLFESKKFKNKAQNILYITLSTGVGSGIITDGKINQGLKNSEIGRIPIEFDGRVREWEEFASARAIFNVYGKYASEISKPRQWQNIADRISRGFLVITPIIQPELIIIGGSLGENFKKFDLFLEQIVRKNLPEGISCPKIVQAQKPREAVIYGCFEFAKEALNF
jgi:glucokinase